MKKMNFTANDVEQMIENQRAFYFTGATKDVEFRKEQLVKLKETIKYNVNNNLLMDKLLIELGGLENDRSNRC